METRRPKQMRAPRGRRRAKLETADDGQPQPGRIDRSALGDDRWRATDDRGRPDGRARRTGDEDRGLDRCAQYRLADRRAPLPTGQTPGSFGEVAEPARARAPE